MRQRLLLDTHMFLWLMLADKRVPAHLYELCSHAEEVYLSSISAWEIAQKYAQKKLPLPKPPSVLLREARQVQHIETLPFSEDDVGILQKLPLIHKDPFDRMLICQAIQHNLTFITDDVAIRQYPIATYW